MFWTYFIVYGVAFGILSSIAVRKKNRDQAGWFFLGLMFGVFGLIAAILVEKIESESQFEAVSTRFDPSVLTKKCPDCAEQVKLEAKVCRFCQHKFPEEEIARQVHLAEEKWTKLAQSSHSHPSSAKSRLIHCPNCDQSESIAENQLFGLNRYTKFDARIKSSFGFQSLHLRCRNCNTQFTVQQAADS